MAVCRSPKPTSRAASASCSAPSAMACPTRSRPDAMSWRRFRSPRLRSRSTSRRPGRLPCTNAGAGRRPQPGTTLPRPAADKRVSELDLRRLAGGLVTDLEELTRLEAKRPGDDVRRNGLNRVVVVQHRVVVDLARGLDLVLGLGQLGLELLEVLGRAELRVGLGDGEELAERLAEDVLGRPLRGGPLGVLSRGSSLSDLVEGAALVGRVALHGLD